MRVARRREPDATTITRARLISDPDHTLHGRVMTKGFNLLAAIARPHREGPRRCDDATTSDIMTHEETPSESPSSGSLLEPAAAGLASRHHALCTDRV